MSTESKVLYLMSVPTKNSLTSFLDQIKDEKWDKSWMLVTTPDLDARILKVTNKGSIMIDIGRFLSDIVFEENRKKLGFKDE